MSDRIADRIARQHAEELTRLADRAARDGVRILLTGDGAHFATSAIDPTRLHRVDAEGCDCNRFRWFGRCEHRALLLAELGMIPEDADAALVALVEDRFQELVDDGDATPLAGPVTIVLVDREPAYAAAGAHHA